VEANEVMQDVFVKIWNSITTYDAKKATLYTWMLNIARNSAIDRLKSKSFQNDLKNQSIPDFVNDNAALSTEQVHEFHEVQKGVNSLRDEYKILINKAYFGGLTQEEISEDLGIPLGTVKTRTRAALSELKNILKDFKFIILFFLIK
jgi:RNA polymerase sigma-70 factor (ECF subfamily)